jgi:hypothetical protein
VVITTQSLCGLDSTQISTKFVCFSSDHTFFFVKIAQIFVKSTQNVCVEKSHTFFFVNSLLSIVCHGFFAHIKRQSQQQIGVLL